MIPALLVPSVRPIGSTIGNLSVGSVMQFTFRQNLIGGGFTDYTTGPAWSSSNQTVASVSSSGLVTGLAVGSATITATLTGVTATFAFKVTSGQAQDGSLADLRNVATDAVLYGIYSGVSGVVLDGSNNVSTWNDVRGATGYGPPLTQATANARPAYNAGTGTLTFDGSNDVLASATASALALTNEPKFILYLGTIANGSYFAGFVSADGSRLLALGTPAGVVRAHTPTADASTAIVAPDANQRAIVMQYGFAPTIPGDATSNTAWLGVEVEPKLRTLANPESSIEASGDTGITIGGLSVFGQFGAIVVKEYVTGIGEVTAPIRAAWERYATARGAVQVSANARAFGGWDSIFAGFNTRGDGATHPEDSIFGLLIADGTLASRDTANMGTPGRWIRTVALRPGLASGDVRFNDILVDIGGTNDIQGGRTPAQVAADKQSLWKGVKAGGGKVLAIGMTPRTGFDVTPYNAAISSFGSDTYDYFINPQTLTGANDFSNPAQSQDGLHPLKAVNQVIVDRIHVVVPASFWT